MVGAKVFHQVYFIGTEAILWLPLATPDALHSAHLDNNRISTYIITKSWTPWIAATVNHNKIAC